MNLTTERRKKVFDRVRDNLDVELSVPIPNGITISFYNNTEFTFRIVRDCQIFEPDTAVWIERMPPDGLLWDIGSNVGFFTLYAASLLSGDGIRVVAFEPAAANYGALNRNIEGNAMTDHVVAFCIALAETTRIGRLNMDAAAGGTLAGSFVNGFESEIGPLDQAINTQFRQGSVGFSIDDFVEMFQPPLPTHIKMDVDGIEAAILRGGKRTLSENFVRSMIIELEGDLNSDRNRELFGLMAELGFVPRPRLSPELRNVVFERPV